MMIALGLLVVFFQVMTDGLFLVPRNVTSLLVQNGYILILAIGMVMAVSYTHLDVYKRQARAGMPAFAKSRAAPSSKASRRSGAVAVMMAPFLVNRVLRRALPPSAGAARPPRCRTQWRH